MLAFARINMDDVERELGIELGSDAATAKDVLLACNRIVRKRIIGHAWSGPVRRDDPLLADNVIARVERLLALDGGLAGFVAANDPQRRAWPRLRSAIWLAIFDRQREPVGETTMIETVVAGQTGAQA